jgi:hypothetical protein
LAIFEGFGAGFANAWKFPRVSKPDSHKRLKRAEAQSSGNLQMRFSVDFRHLISLVDEFSAQNNGQPLA